MLYTLLYTVYTQHLGGAGAKSWGRVGAKCHCSKQKTTDFRGQSSMVYMNC